MYFKNRAINKIYRHWIKSRGECSSDFHTTTKYTPTHVTRIACLGPVHV